MSDRITRRVKYPFGVTEFNEDDLLNGILFKEHFRKLPKEQQVVLGLRLLNYTQSIISRILNISRTSVGTLEKKAVGKLREAMQAR